MNSKIDIVTLSNNNGTGTVTVLDSFIINTGTVYQEYTVQLPVTTDDFLVLDYLITEQQILLMFI